MTQLFGVYLALFCSSLLGVTGNSVWRVPNGGTLGAWGPVNLADSTNAVTGVLPEPNMAASNFVQSGSSGTFTMSSNTPAQPTNLSVSITVSGTRPVLVWCQSAATGSFSSNGSFGSTNASPGLLRLLILNGATTISQYDMQGPGLTFWPGSAFSTLDAPTAGTKTYSIQIANSGSGTVSATNVNLNAMELK